MRVSWERAARNGGSEQLQTYLCIFSVISDDFPNDTAGIYEICLLISPWIVQILEMSQIAESILFAVKLIIVNLYLYHNHD